MIHDIRYLENTHLPGVEVVDHNQKQDRLRGIVTPTRDTSRVDGAIGVVGPPGSGKTTVVNHSLRECAPDDARIARVNCWRHRSCEDVLHAIADALLDIPDQRDTPCATLVDTLQESADTPRYVILDEADQLPNTDILYSLSESPNLQVHLIAESLVGVEERLDDRTRSRLRSGTLLEFEPYSPEELARILRERADRGLSENTISDAELTRIAAEAEGDARVAIDTLRKAAFVASDDDADSIFPGHVTHALPIETPRERAGGEHARDDHSAGGDAPPVSDLSPDCAVLSRLVADAGEIAPGKLYERYTETVEDPHSNRHVRDLMAQLQKHNVLERHGHGPATQWTVAESGPRVYLEE